MSKRLMARMVFGTAPSMPDLAPGPPLPTYGTGSGRRRSSRIPPVVPVAGIGPDPGRPGPVAGIPPVAPHRGLNHEALE